MVLVKILVLVRFIYCLWKIWVGKSSGVNIRDILIDVTYLIFLIYLVFRFQSFSPHSVFLDSLLSIVFLVYMIELFLLIKIYFITKDFGLNPENRLIYFVESLIKKNKQTKIYRVLSSHLKIVKNSSPLLIYLGDAYLNRHKYEDAYSCFVEATENTNDESLLINATTKAFHVCAKELKDVDSAQEFIQEQIKRDISLRHITELEKLMKENVA